MYKSLLQQPDLLCGLTTAHQQYIPIARFDLYLPEPGSKGEQKEAPSPPTLVAMMRARRFLFERGAALHLNIVRHARL